MVVEICAHVKTSVRTPIWTDSPMLLLIWMFVKVNLIVKVSKAVAVFLLRHTLCGYESVFFWGGAGGGIAERVIISHKECCADAH